MTYCSRCLLNHAYRVLNLVLNACGMAMIIYSLWLLKTWKQGLAELDTTSSFPTPWFIYSTLGVGIVVCFSAIAGQVISNLLNPIALLIYIIFISLTITFQIVGTVQILYKIDWSTVISRLVEGNTKFVATFVLHANICRLIEIVILLEQVNVLVLSIVLMALGPQPRNQCEGRTVPELTCSFLVVGGSESPPSLPATTTPRQEHLNLEPAFLTLLRAAYFRWMNA